MKRIGLTGGIGCGKSTVVAELRRQGIPCYVADDVARGFYDDPDFVARVGQALGAKVANADGTADRQAIARIVFADAEKLAILNRLIHPLVMERFDHFCSEQRGQKAVFFESAILYEHGLDKAMDAVATVYLDRQERIRRLAERDHSTEGEISARMANQLPDEEKLARADFVILNYEGNPRQRQVREMLERLAGKETQQAKQQARQ